MTTATRHASTVAALFAELAAQTPNWQALGACRIEDADLWFPVGQSREALEQEAEAKAVCYRCPVIDRCLSWALETRQDVGVWGGLSEEERRRMHKRKRPVYRGGEQTAVDNILQNRMDEWDALVAQGASDAQMARGLGTNGQTIINVRQALEQRQLGVTA
jgi:hypothetical protein